MGIMIDSGVESDLFAGKWVIVLKNGALWVIVPSALFPQES
jgi:hypothetical protein